MLKIFKWYFSEKISAKDEIKELKEHIKLLQHYKESILAVVTNLITLNKNYLIPRIAYKQYEEIMEILNSGQSKGVFTKSLNDVLDENIINLKHELETAKGLYKEAAYLACQKRCREAVTDSYTKLVEFEKQTKRND